MIDTHCHLYLPEFADDIENVISRAVAEGVEKFYFPAIDSETTTVMLDLEGKFPGTCISMMGLHPCSVKGNYEEELRWVKDWLERRKFSAIGEIGLDFHWDKTFIPQQCIAFQQQVDWAKEYDLPIVIHSRDAMQECIDLVKKNQDGSLKGIFHCFSGNEKEAKQIVDLGLFLGIGGVVTYKNAGLAEALENIDLSYMVLETDAPYLTPVPFRGKRNESSYLKYVIQKLATIKNTTVEEVARITTGNAQKIFSH